MEDEIELTDEEQKAIRSLERLAKKWPSSLMIFAGGTGLSIRKPTENGCYGSECEVANISGIWNDGGDGADSF